MSWTNLKATISAVIKANNKQEITGTILNSIFNSVINNLGANAQFAGIATPETPLVVQDGPTFWIAGQAGTYNIGGNAVKVGHATLAIFTWDCSTWDIGLMSISGVITVDNLIEAVQEATEEIRADLESLREQINSELQAYVNDGSYNRETKKIELKHSDTVLASIDAADFIVDGMVDDVRIENGNLVIDFNTASGKQDIEIPLTDIFNPSNYYTKVEVNSALLSKANLVNGLVPDSELPKADAAGTTAGIVRLRTNSQGVNRSGLTIASDGGMQVHVNNGLRIDGVGRLNASLEENGGLEFGSNNGIQMKTATDADVEEGTSTEKALTPSNMEKIKSEVTDSIMPEIGPDAAGHEYVDLGLPSGTLWATMNVGAESETDYGLYFQWGDTQGYAADQVGSGEGKKYFGWADDKYGDGTSSPDANDMTKYNATDGKTTLDLEDDAVAANWGGSWRMPTEEQFQELLNTDNCTRTWITLDGVNGCLFTSKTNGNTLFIPANGNASKGYISDVNGHGYVWSNTLYTSNILNGYYFSFGPVNSYRSYNHRFYGYSVRGVLDDSITPSSKLHKVAVSGDYNDLENKPDLTAKADLTNGLVPDSELPKADAAGTTAGIVKLRTNGQGVNRSGLTVASDGGLQVFPKNGLSIGGDGTLSANIHGVATAEEIAAGTATNKALTPSNLNDVLSALLGKNFGGTGHTIGEILQHVADSMKVLVATVWADVNCTEDPRGKTLDHVFIRVEDASAFIRGFSIGQSVYTSGGMLSSEPLDEDGSCNVMLWADYTGSNEGPLSSGDILDMYINAGAGEYEIPDNYTTAFYL